MSNYTETISNKLNTLLEHTYDAEKGYQKAAEHTDHNLLKSYFNRRSKERHDFGRHLKNEIIQFGETPEKTGSLTGSAHRTWMDTKALFSVNTAEAMLEESIRGEKTAVKDYEEVLKDAAIPPNTSQLLTQQMNSIKSDLNTIKFLEDLS